MWHVHSLDLTMVQRKSDPKQNFITFCLPGQNQQLETDKHISSKSGNNFGLGHFQLFQTEHGEKNESFCSNWFCYCTYPQFSGLSSLISSVMQIDSPLHSNSHYGLKDTMAYFSGVGTDRGKCSLLLHCPWCSVMLIVIFGSFSYAGNLLDRTIHRAVIQPQAWV